MNKIKRNSFLAASAGTALEFYDVTLYGFFSTLLASLFFPTKTAHLSLLASLGTFAAGFVMRPLGGIAFGYIGDRYGRKKTLVFATLLVTFPTFIIGMLPTYETIGIMAPIILIVCRLLQGLCVGGEYSGAAVFMSEHAEVHQKGFAGSLLCSSAFLGAIIGSLIGAVCTVSWMPYWGWRIPFLLGGFFGLIALLYRQKIEEPGVFRELSQDHQLVSFPLKQAFKQNKLSLLCTFAIGASVQIPFYISSIYMSLILGKKMALSTSESLLLNTMVMMIWMLLLPLAGYLSDRWKSFYLMKFSIIGVILFSYPIFFCLELYPSVTTIICSQLTLSFLGVWYMGVSPSLMPKLFPIQHRISGMGISFGLGQAIFSGTTPFIVSVLVGWTGDEKAPAYYLILTSLLGLMAITLAKKILRSPLESRSI